MPGAAALLAVGSLAAAAPAATAYGYHTVRATIAKSAVAVPTSVRGGYVEFDVRNQSGAPTGLQPFRLNPGKTVDDLLAAAQSPDFSDVEKVGTLYGGASVAGSRASFVARLKAGHYVALAFGPGARPTRHSA